MVSIASDEVHLFHPAPSSRLPVLALHLRDREVWRFARFLATGSVNFVFYYSLFTTLHLLDVKPVPAVIAATGVAILFNFVTTGRFVFRSGRMKLLPRFFGVYLVQCAANIALLRLLIAAGMPVLVAEALVIGTLAVATFFALRRFVFSPAVIEDGHA